MPDTGKHSFEYYFLWFLLSVALLSPFLAGEVPLLRIHNKNISFPVLYHENIAWNKLLLTTTKFNGDLIIQPLIPWNAGQSDFDNSNFKSPFETQHITSPGGTVVNLPFRYRHWFGTTLRGADLLSGLVKGTRISLLVGGLAALISSVIGFIFGSAGGMFAGKGYNLSRAGILSGLIFIPAALNIIQVERIYHSNLPVMIFIFAVLLFSMFMLYKLLSRLYFFKRRIALPLDGLIMRMNELFTTFPRLVIILLFAAFLKPSVMQVILLLGLTGWTDLARVVRGEFLKMRNMNFTESARLSGASQFRIFTRHLLPNAWPAFSIAIFFTVAMNILTEAGLSFLGFGVPADVVTWGSLMSEGKDEINAWWMIIFPGIFLSLTIVSLLRLSALQSKGRGLI